MNVRNHAVKCSECRHMGMLETVPLVQKGHPCRELNPHRETQPFYLDGGGDTCKCKKLTHAANWTPHSEMQPIGGSGDPFSQLSQCSECSHCRYMVVGAVSLLQKGHHHNVIKLATFSCMGSIPLVDDLFVLRALSPPLCTYIGCISLCECNSMYECLP